MGLEFNDIKMASDRLKGRVNTTPLLQSSRLEKIAGGRVFVKAEVLQKSGSFKFRGALNKMLCLTEKERRRGVIAFSSGNHALAVSLAAYELGIFATVLMPSDAPTVKINGARKNGAEVVLYNRAKDNREAICQSLCFERGLTLIPPYDDYQIMSGAGTGAIEAINQLPSGNTVDTLAVNCSGGGLAAGWAVAAKTLLPSASIFAIEPEAFDDTSRSLRQGERVVNASSSTSICDALLVPTPGKLTFEELKKCAVLGASVSDDEVREAVKFAFHDLKLVVEPGGAAALAGVLTGKVRSESKNDILIILSGGNVDPLIFFECIN